MRDDKFGFVKSPVIINIRRLIRNAHLVTYVASKGSSGSNGA